MNSHATSSTGEIDKKLEVYKERYKHELLLNERTAEFELSALRPAIILNGGAVVAFLTLIGAVWKAGSHPDLAQVGMALAIWCGGLVVGSLAIGYGYVSQRTFARMIKVQRKDLEASVLGEPGSKSETDSDISTERGNALKYQNTAIFLIIGSLLLFLIGVLFAYKSLLS